MMTVFETPLYWAIDGGGSGCRVRVADDTRVLADLSGGPANWTSAPDDTIHNLQDAIARANQAVCSARNGGPAPTHSVAHVGLAGVLSAQDQDRIQTLLPFDRCAVSDDRVTTLAGALADRDGAVLAVGTGSFAARRQGADIRYLGGWGLIVGDQASGAWLGRAALERCLLTQDGLHPASPLTAQLIDAFDNDPLGVVAFAARATPAEFGAFAPQIVQAARAQDHTALALMRLGAAYLARCLRHFDLSGDEIVCLTGGLGPEYGPYLPDAIQARSVPPAGTALDGAMRLAKTLGGDAP